MDGDKRETIALNVQRLGENRSELLVTLTPVRLSGSADTTVEPEHPAAGSSQQLGESASPHSGSETIDSFSAEIGGDAKLAERPVTEKATKPAGPGNVIDKLGGYGGARRYDADLDKEGKPVSWSK